MDKNLTMMIKGVDYNGIEFNEKAEFELVKSSKENDYGTKYYMMVNTTCDKFPPNKHLIDVRYAGTTNIQKLADAWIKEHYGENVKEVEEV